MRLDLALIRLHPELSRRKAREVIEAGQVSVDGLVVREAGLAVASAAALLWQPHRRKTPKPRFSLPFLYADEHLVVVDKPPGLLSVPSAPGTREDTVLGRIREDVRRRGGRGPVRAVHRLDRNTSGALCLALSAPAAAGLIDLFRRHEVERRYLALVEGEPAAEAGRIDAAVADVYVSGRRRLARPGEAARPAQTRWRVVERFGRAALLELTLLTGRQHQIRLHLAHAGLPVLGDPVYRERSGPPPLQAPRQMLHAHVLAFAHPLHGGPVRTESPLPPDFARAVSRLRRRLG